MLMLKMNEFKICQAFLNFPHTTSLKYLRNFSQLFFTTFSIHKIVTEKNSSQFKNWHIAANKMKYFPHELIWQFSNIRYSKATLHAKLKSQKTLWKKN